MPAPARALFGGRTRRETSAGQAEHVERRWVLFAAVVAAHAVFALLMRRFPAFTTLHAVASLIAGASISMAARRSGTVLAAAAYITGSEIVWRMCRAVMFHEIAKYALCVVFGVALIRMRRPRLPRSALLYFALLIPSIVTPFFLLPLERFRKEISFNLSGPLALAIAVCFCLSARVTRRELWRIAPVLAGPLAGAAAITLFTTYSREAIRFSSESNFITSGGFGPNQVSSALAFGALVLLFYFLYEPASLVRRLLVLLLVILFAIQSAMTFSRSGLLSVLLSFVLVSPLVLRGRRARLALLGMLVAFGLATALAFPRLNEFTGGKLAVRFQDTELSGRESFMREDLESWKSAPIFGVGVGIAKFGRSGFTAAHTEFSRCLAEHGLFGALSVMMLLALAARPLLACRRELAPVRPFLIAMAAWTLLYLTVNGMRLAAPSFAFGLALLGSPRPAESPAPSADFPDAASLRALDR